MKSLIATLLLICILPAAADQTEEDIQSFLAKILLQEEIELVRNDTDYPLRVTKERIGSFFICFDTTISRFHLFRLKPSHFKKGEDGALLLCQKSGQIKISGDYI